MICELPDACENRPKDFARALIISPRDPWLIMNSLAC